MGLGIVDLLKSLFIALEPFYKFAAISFFIYLAYYSFFKKDKSCCIVLALLCALVFDEYMDIGVGIPGIEFAKIKFSELVLFYGIFACKKSKLQATPLKNQVIILVIILGFFFILGSLRSIISDTGYNEGLYAFRYEILDKLLFFILVSSGFEEIKDYKKFMLVFSIFVFFVSIPNLQMYIHGWDYGLFPSSDRQIEYIVKKHSQHAGRFGGYFVVSNRSGVFCATVIPLIFSVFITTLSKKKKMLFATSLIFAGVALLSTNSRSAMLGIVVGISSILFLGKSSNFTKASYTVLTLIMLTALAPTLYSRVSERFATIETPTEDVSANQRLILYDMTAKIILDNPLLGIGYGEGNFKKKVSEYGGIAGVHDNPHNSYLHYAVMLGIPALIVFLLIIALFFKTALNLNRSHYFSQKREIHAIHTGLIGGISALLIGVTFNPILFVHSISSTLWIFIGLGVSMNSIRPDLAKNKRQQATSTK